MNTVIAATSYTELSENAVEYAAEVARANKVRLVLLNEYTIPVSGVNGWITGPQIEEMLAKNKHRLQQEAEELSKKFEIEVVPVANFLYFENDLKSLIEEYKADLVVMGMAPKSLESDLLGNTTTSVLQSVRVPLLAVPENAKFKGAKNVLFACDVLNGTSELLLARVKNLAITIGAKVEVLMVNQKVEELSKTDGAPSIYNNVTTGLEGIDYYYRNVKSDSVIHSIEKEVKRFKADLLIMVPQKHGFWNSLVHRSKTRMMATGLNIPLLSIPA
jgi:nucleotide-binding universal stress UspA family protein